MRAAIRIMPAPVHGRNSSRNPERQRESRRSAGQAADADRTGKRKAGACRGKTEIYLPGTEDYRKPLRRKSLPWRKRWNAWEAETGISGNGFCEAEPAHEGKGRGGSASGTEDERWMYLEDPAARIEARKLTGSLRGKDMEK